MKVFLFDSRSCMPIRRIFQPCVNMKDLSPVPLTLSLDPFIQILEGLVIHIGYNYVIWKKGEGWGVQRERLSVIPTFLPLTNMQFMVSRLGGAWSPL